MIWTVVILTERMMILATPITMPVDLVIAVDQMVELETQEVHRDMDEAMERVDREARRGEV
jgi:hypothetical protein